MRRQFAPKSIALSFVAALICSVTLRAGTPARVAGSVYFDPAVKGTPLTWAQGSIAYYTDQGDLSPILLKPAADALVADAFSRWTNIPTAAVSATAAGQLAEDVNGSNVTIASSVLTMPADIQPDALSQPLALVYDLDGAVTDILLGTGSSADCFNNAVFGGSDNFSTDAHLTHALVILNGTCAQAQTQIPDFEYRLIRVLGRVLGLGASQLNVNVWSGNPPPSAADRAGFPLMHAIDLPYCDPISNCLPSADQPKMDDRAALSRLYPVTIQNQNNFSTKTLFFENTGRIHGSVRFPNSGAQPGPGMQGVNVVARWLDPVTFQPSHAYAISSVSGFLFCGNRGNPITGTTDPLGQPYARFGSDDPALAGYFDLAGLEFPDGNSTAIYELTVEPINPLYSESVGPYAPWQVRPSGLPDPIYVTVSRGQDVLQDIVMTGGAQLLPDWFSSQNFTQPVAIPAGGDWLGRINVPGSTNYYQFSAQANRTFSIEALALDETGQSATDKVQPVIGMWALPDPLGYPPPSFTPAPFNTVFPALSRLDSQVLSSGPFRIGVADLRGDGRPDFAYHIRVLYGDSASPARVSAAGGTVAIQGLGFRSQLSATAGNTNVSILDFNATQLRLGVPALPDGQQTIQISDPATGSASTMTDVITSGAAATDLIRLLPVSNPVIAVGGETVNPLQFRVLATDGSPVSGATVSLSASNNTTLGVCGASTCTVLSDASGRVITHATPAATGTTTITTTLAPASYSTPSTATASLTASASALDVSLFPQQFWVEKGASLDVPLTARILNQGSPVSGTTVNYKVTVGSGTLLQNSSTTDSGGYVRATLRISQLASDQQVSACVAPANTTCKTFTLTAVPASALLIEPVANVQQITLQGAPIATVILRVTDSSTPPNAVLGANVRIYAQEVRAPLVSPTPPPLDDVGGSSNGSVLILASAQSLLLSDADGIVQFAPWATLLTGGLEAVGSASADSGAAVQFSAEVISPPNVSGGTGVPARPGSARARAPALHTFTFSATGPPSRLRSGTRGGSSAASAPSVLRRGSTASWKARRGVEE